MRLAVPRMLAFHAAGPERIISEGVAEADVFTLLAAAEEALQRGDAAAALRLTETSIRRSPELPVAHFMAGRLFQLDGDLPAAKAAYEKAALLKPDLAVAWCNLAYVEVERGDYTQALAAGRKALALNQADVDALLVTGRALLLLKRSEGAEKVLRRAAALDPARAAAHHALGRALQDLGRSREAIECQKEAIKLDPESATAWHGLGLALRSLGHFEDAIGSFSRAVEMAPGFGEALGDLAICRRVNAEQTRTPALLAIVNAEELPTAQRISAGFALAKELDEIGHYNQAFSYLSEANRLFREDVTARGKGFCPERFRCRIDRLIKFFTIDFIQAHGCAASHSDMPVFVVGHYRSGTTLIEQILASHPAVHGAGELQDMLRLAGSMNLEVWPDTAALTQLQSAGRTHVERLRASGREARRVVDKHPDNVLALGLIAMLYPKAKIIVSHRNILDNVLSCFFQRFSENMSFSNDLGDCARRHLEVERLIAHWRRVLPMKMLEINYESLVDDSEVEIRRLIDFVGLPWSDECLNFYRTERTVNTPSVWGVRQPIYTSAVGRWRNYAKHMQEVVAISKSQSPVSKLNLKR